MKRSILAAMAVLCLAASAQAETVVYAQITYPTSTTWRLYLTETTNWGSPTWTPDGFGICSWCVTIVGATPNSIAVNRTPADTILYKWDPEANDGEGGYVWFGEIGFRTIAGGTTVATGAGLVDIESGQSLWVPETVFTGFGVTAGSYVIPADCPDLSLMGGSYSWGAPNLADPNAPGMYVYSGLRPSGGKVSLSSDQTRNKANVFRDAAGSRCDTVNVVSGLPPSVNAGPDRRIGPQEWASLAGSVTDDGQPSPPGITTVAWSVTSGPGSVTIANHHAPATTASFSQQGTYVLRLSASDSQFTSFEEMTVIVASIPPVVNAGPDQTLSSAMAATLAGTVSDDGYPAATTATWSMTSGGRPVTFADPNALVTTVRFSQFGTYVLRLSASDSESSAYDEVTIVVHPNPQGDFNGDGHVDGHDFLLWQVGFPKASGATRANGDANGDGKVDGLDFLCWQLEYGLEHQN
jgi:hypothetical protein